MRDEERAADAYQFQWFVGQLIQSLLTAPIAQVTPGDELGVDFVVELRSGSLVLVEVKAYTPSTSSRLTSVIRNFELNTEDAPDGVRISGKVLAITGVLSDELAALVARHHVTLWDGHMLRTEAEKHGIAIPAGVDLARGVSLKKPEWMQLSRRLRSTLPGRHHWTAYQQLCGDILSFLFRDVLEAPLEENSNQSQVNRRDFIFPNYSTDGFWSFLRQHYRADFIVVEAKNYEAPIKKDQVLQLANYLTTHGTGLFGMLVTRAGANRSAVWTQREQWVLHNKLVVVLTDADLRQMLTTKANEGDPSVVIRQKIEDFRLGL